MIALRTSGPEGLAWFREKVGGFPDMGPEFRGIEAFRDDGRIVGFVGFDHWTPNSARMHVAVDEPAACRSLLRMAFEWPFRQSGKGVVLGEIRESNRKACRLARRLGFREVFRTRDGWEPGVDLIHFEMRREECRWLDG